MEYYTNYLKTHITRKHIFVTSGILAVLGSLGTIGYLVKTGRLSLFEDDKNKNNSEKIVVDEDINKKK
jgi:hypothetical protein